MKTLFVERQRVGSYNQTTTLKDENGKVVAIFGAMLRQPRKNSKKITINCFSYHLDWSGVN